MTDKEDPDYISSFCKTKIFLGFFDSTKIPGRLIVDNLDPSSLKSLSTTSTSFHHSLISTFSTLKIKRKETVRGDIKNLTIKVEKFSLKKPYLYKNVLGFAIFSFMGLFKVIQYSNVLFSSNSKLLNQSNTDNALVIGGLMVALSYYCSLFFKYMRPMVEHYKNYNREKKLSELQKILTSLEENSNLTAPQRQ